MTDIDGAFAIGLVAAAVGFVEQSPGNYVSKEDAIMPELVGLKLFDAPLFAFGDARDPLFEALKDPAAVGEHVIMPQEWLPGARTVVSFFVPFSDAVKQSNASADPDPSPEWLHGRIEGHEFVKQISAFVAGFLQEAGFEAVAPSLDPRFTSANRPGLKPGLPATMAYTCNWPERHAGYISGLGTFSLSKGLITQKGVCGRLGSVITTAAFEPTARPYSGLEDYCSHCGACAKRCPTGAITLEGGKDDALCMDCLDRVHAEWSPRYGCGKCQAGVPCESRIANRTTRKALEPSRDERRAAHRSERRERRTAHRADRRGCRAEH